MKKIFFAEDDKYIRKIYERAFRAAGFGPVTASDGEEALRELEIMETPPAAIVLDVQLAKASGLDVLRKLREEHRFDGVPVAILTNALVDDLEQKFKELGAALYMMKIDYEPQEVVEKIAKLIEEHEKRL